MFSHLKVLEIICGKSPALRVICDCSQQITR